MSFSQTMTYDTTSQFSYPSSVQITGGAASLINSSGYSTANPVILCQDRVMATSLSGFTASSTASAPDAVQYQLQINNQYYWWNATTWILADGTYATSNVASDINTNASTLFSALGLTGTQFIQVRAFLHSATGSGTPTLTSVTLTYGLTYGTPITIPQCLVYAYVKNLLGGIPYNAAAPITLYVKNQRSFFYGNTVIAPFTQSVVFDSTGYAQLSVVETTTPGEKVEFFLTYYDKNSLRSVKFNNAAVPNLATAALNSFTDVSTLDFG